MKIKELIELLSSHPNPEAKVSVIMNPIHPEDYFFDRKATMDVFNTDDFYEDFIELFVHDASECAETDKYNNLNTFFSDMGHDKITIELDTKSGIFVFDSYGGVLREIEFKDVLCKEHAISEIQNKLLNIIRG